jgi:hypothetical protein
MFDVDANRDFHLSKDEYYKKWEISELLDDLEKAAEMLSHFEGGYSNQFIGAEEFHNALEVEIDDIAEGNKNDLSQIWIWFAPTTSWDDFVGLEGMDLGNKIFERVDKWRKGNRIDIK